MKIQCLILRWFRDERNRPTSKFARFLANHVQECAECRLYLGRHRLLEEWMRGEVSQKSVAVPESLRSGIRAQIRSVPSPREMRSRGVINDPIFRPSFGMLKWALVMITCSLVIVGVIRRSEKDRAAHEQLAQIPPALSKLLVASASVAPQLEWENLDAELTSPLRGEMDSLIVDARSALNLLVQNFVPTNASE